MKSYSNAFLLFFLCVASVQGQAVRGSGKVSRKQVPVAGFTKLHNLSAANLYLTGGDKTAGVVIEADDNILPYIEVAERDGVLIIRHKDNAWFNTKNNINVYVPVKTLAELKNNGSGNLTGQTTIATPELVFENNGSGNAELSLDTPSLHLNHRGSGNVRLAGKAQALTLHFSGSGNLDAAPLDTRTAQVKLSGSGNIDLKCSGSLTAHLSGSGNLTYAGNPEVVQKLTGSGEIRRKRN